MRWERAGAAAAAMGLLVSVSVVACSSEGPPRCLVVDLTTSPEKQRLMEDLAGRFNRSDAAHIGDGCTAVEVHALPSGQAEELLSQGWPHEEVNGPAPVIWSPASSSWALLLRRHRDEWLAAHPEVDPRTVPVAEDFRSLARTPLVIAMPRSRAEALGWPHDDIGFADVLRLAQADLVYPCEQEGLSDQLRTAVVEWCDQGPFTLGKTNPHLSTAGLGALIAQAYAATGRTELTVDTVEDPQVEAFARGIESSVAHYGETSLTFLENWMADDQERRPPYVDAIAVEEKQVIDYNRGDPTGLELRPGETGRRPHERIVAMYPSGGTFWSDNPAFVLDVDWVSEDLARAAHRFVEFARRPASQRVVLDYGFRPVAESRVPVEGPLFTADHGVDPAPVPELDVPGGDVLDALVRQWDEQRRSARVLFVIDVSSSMGNPAHPDVGERSKLDVAQHALVRALLPPAGEGPPGEEPLFKPDDIVGLWAFSTRMDAHPVYADELGCRDRSVCEIVPPAPYGEIEEGLPDAISALSPHDGTPLYDAIDRAFRSARDHYEPSRINAVVVLSDGDNNDGEDSDDRAQYQELIQMLSGADRAERAGDQAQRPVRVFTIAYGSDANRQQLQAIAEASDAGFYDASDPRTLERIVVDVVSNF